MRELKRGLLFIAILIALVAALALSSAGSTIAASSRSPAFQNPIVDMTVSIAPLNVEPGQQAIVTVTLRNVSPGPLAPEVEIILPSSVSTRFGELPAGTIFNAQSGILSWQPVLSGNEGELQLRLPIVAQVADPQEPEQEISAVLRAGGVETKRDAKFWIGLAPVASIHLNPPQVAVGQPIQFVGQASGPGPIAQLWALGDGRIVEAVDPTVVYPSPGTYEVVFQASTPMGVINATATVNVTANTIARFRPSDLTPVVGVPVTFDNESGGEQPLSYLWDFGDGSISTEFQPSHSFQMPGTYDIRLFVTGANSQSESIETVHVGLAPAADFLIGDAVDAGSVVQGQAFTDESATSVTWDFGDGHTSEGSIADHVYWAAGDYPVTVTVANDFGETKLMRLVRVNPGRFYLFLPLVQRAADLGIVVDTQAPTLDQEGQAPPAAEDIQEELPLLDLPADLSPQEMLLAYINEARRLNGLQALEPVLELTAAAQSHAEDMALNGHTSHTGSDGSVPAYRVLVSGYPGGYAGEATAWGMAQAYEPVRYWLASPGHRPIILNPAAKDVGVGFNENYDSPSVWYWTAEFASLDLPVVHVPPPASATPVPDPVLTLLGPPTDGEFVMSSETKLIFTWSWSLPLAPEQRFAVYLNSRGRTIQIGSVAGSESGDQYEFVTTASNVPALPGQQSWFVRLEDTVSGEMHEQSEARTIIFASQP